LIKESGGIGPIVLVYKISKYIHVVDAFSNWKAIRTYEIDSRQYYAHPFKPIATKDNLTEFRIINIESDRDNTFNTSRTALRFKFSFAKLEI